MNSDTKNQEVLKRILRAIELATRYHKFALYFVQCKLVTDQDNYINYLKEQCNEMGVKLIKVDLSRKIIRNLREVILNILNEKFFNGKPDKLTIAVTGLEASILTDINEESPAVLQILNMGREHYARDLPYPSTFWLPGYAITKIASVAPDFWSWRGGGVDKLVSNEESVIQAINEAIRSDEPTDRNEALYQTILLERLIEGHPGSENGTDEQKSEYRKLLYRLGTAYHFLEKYPRAYQNCRRALEIGKLSVDFAQQGKELNALGLVCRAMGKLQKSLNYFTEYLALSEKRGDKEGQGVALGHIGLVYRDMLQNERAIEYLKRARRINKEIRNPSNESDNLGNLGAAYQDIGEFENAIKYHSEALKVSKKIKDWKREIKDLSNLGVAFNSQGKRKKAIYYFQQALELSRKYNDCTSKRDMLIKIGTYFWEQKKLDEARYYYEMAVDTCQEMGDDRNKCDVLIYLAELSHEFNETKGEVALYEKALDLSRKLRDEEKKLHCLKKLIKLHHRQWEPDKAKNYIDEARELLGPNLKLKKINVWLLKDDLYRQPKSLARGRKYYLCLNIGKPDIGFGYSPLRQSDFIYNLAVEGEVSNKQIKAFEKTSRVLGKEQEEIPPPTPETRGFEEKPISVTKTPGPQTILPIDETKPTILTTGQQQRQEPSEVIPEEFSEERLDVSVRLNSRAFEFDRDKIEKRLYFSEKRDSETIYFTITPREIGKQSITVEGAVNDIPFDLTIEDIEVEEAVSTKDIPVEPFVHVEGERVFCESEDIGEYTGELYGIALDIGTTTLAMYLIGLESGKVLSVTSRENPQTKYGNNVISRIGFAETGHNILEREIKNAVNEMITTMVDPDNVFEMVVVGNSVMRDLFFGYSVWSLGKSPYEPLSLNAVNLTKAKELRLKANPRARIYGLPLIGSFVGADALAVVLATEMYKSEKICMAIDIGTNTEIMLGNRDRLIATSCVSGPAFEGASTMCGIGGVSGAIKEVRIENGEVIYKTMGDANPVGVCGSGLIDILAELMDKKIINGRGEFYGDKKEFRMTEGISLSERDIDLLYIAKSAVSGGIKTLMERYGLELEDIDCLFLAGAFEINTENALRIGLLPPIEHDKVKKVGNAAIEGARQALISKTKREDAETVAKRIEHVKFAQYLPWI